MAAAIGDMQFLEDSEDQAQFLTQVLSEDQLTASGKRYVVWSSVMAARNKALTDFAAQLTDAVPDAEKRDMRFALSRMAVTNPYFFSRNFAQVNAGGSLDVLHMRDFQSIQVHDEIGYHYACIAISMVNGGYNCFRSHVSSLQQLGESDDAIDQAMRITSALMAVRQVTFTQEQWGV